MNATGVAPIAIILKFIHRRYGWLNPGNPGLVTRVGSLVNKVLNTLPPGWFWPVCLIGFLWSLAGLLVYLAFGAPEGLPFWTKLVVGVAVVASVLGCIGLLRRRMWSRFVLVVALVALSVEALSLLSAADPWALTTLSSIWSLAAAAVASLLVVLSSIGIRRGWLR